MKRVGEGRGKRNLEHMGSHERMTTARTYLPTSIIHQIGVQIKSATLLLI